MDITVKLQNPFSYALWPIILLGVIVLGIIVTLMILKLNIKPKKKPAPKNEQPKKVQTVDVNRIRMFYLMQLDELEKAFRNEKLSIREAYQNMSRIVRQFVQERTGIQADSYTLNDIKKLNIPKLEALISEFYSPEFSVKSQGDVFAALEKSRRIIEEWN